MRFGIFPSNMPHGQKAVSYSALVAMTAILTLPFSVQADSHKKHEGHHHDHQSHQNHGDHPQPAIAQQLDKETATTWKTKNGTVRGEILFATPKLVTIGKRGTPAKKGKKVKFSDLAPDAQARAKSWMKYNTPPKGFKPQRVVVMGTIAQQMKYDKATFTVKPGQKVQLKLINDDEMMHNLLICKPNPEGGDSGMEVAQAAWALGEEGIKKNYIPKHERLLHATNLVMPHTVQSIFFTAPKKEGSYPYVCSVPGHAMMMKGIMKVSKASGPVKSDLMNLTYKIYEGSWKKVPDFDALKPVKEGKLPKGFIDIKLAKKKSNFGMLFEGDLEFKEDGKQTFTVASDDGAKLWVDDELVVNHDGLHPATTKHGIIERKKGTYKFKFAYFQGGGGMELFMSWKTPTSKNKDLTAPQKGKKKKRPEVTTGKPLIASNEAIIYRNFIEGNSARGIGVGFPGGTSYCFDANNMCLAMIWDGGFIDAARHWTNRGKGFQPPLGNLHKLTQQVQFAELPSKSASWPDDQNRASNKLRTGDFIFRGYKLNKLQMPTYLYTYKGIKFEDFIEPAGSGSNAALKRTIRISNGGATKNLWFRVGTEAAEQNGTYTISKQVNVNMTSGGSPAIVNSELRLPVSFKNGQAQIELTYTWTKGPVAEVTKP